MASAKAERILFGLHAMPISTEFKKKFYLRLCTLPHSEKFKLKMFSPTAFYATQGGVDSGLCCIVGSHDSALCCIARSCYFTLCGIVQSQHVFTNFSANVQLYAKIFKPIVQ
jgi:hypothetical protein